MTNSSAILDIRVLSKRYGAQDVLSGVSFSVAAGECVLLLGANGSGKSTLLRCCASLVRASKGVLNSPNVESIGYCGHAIMLYDALSVYENLKIHATCQPNEVDVDRTMERWQLNEFRQRLIADCSRGVQARAALARAHLGEPALLLLDEPTTALDDRSVELLRAELRQRTRHSAIVVATHDIERLRLLATRAIVLNKGKVLFDSFEQQASVDDAIDCYRKSNR